MSPFFRMLLYEVVRAQSQGTLIVFPNHSVQGYMNTMSGIVTEIQTEILGTVQNNPD